MPDWTDVLNLLATATDLPGTASRSRDHSRHDRRRPQTLRLSWSDFPIDNGLSLYVDAVGVGYRFLLIQPAPTGPSDAIAEDRILELTFDHDISSAEVEASLQEGLDTSN